MIEYLLWYFLGCYLWIVLMAGIIVWDHKYRLSDVIIKEIIFYIVTAPVSTPILLFYIIFSKEDNKK